MRSTRQMKKDHRFYINKKAAKKYRRFYINKHGIKCPILSKGYMKKIAKRHSEATLNKIYHANQSKHPAQKVNAEQINKYAMNAQDKTGGV